MERHLFPGANTPQGFYSYFSSILPQEDARRIVILKGGPGVGKSTFMLRTAQAMAEDGLDVEYFHCSSDPSSLDAIHVPAKGFAMMDGTAPHGMVS